MPVYALESQQTVVPQKQEFYTDNETPLLKPASTSFHFGVYYGRPYRYRPYYYYYPYYYYQPYGPYPYEPYPYGPYCPSCGPHRYHRW